jgi:hypothetical protein
VWPIATKDAVDFQFARFAAARVFDDSRLHDFLVLEERDSFSSRMRLAHDIDNGRVQHELDFRIVLRTLQHDFGSAELIAAMHQVNLVH